MRGFILCFVLILAGASAGCNAPTASTPTTPEKSLDESRQEVVDQLKTFLTDNYPDWHLQGTAIGVVDAIHLNSVNRKRLFDVHLIKGKDSKVITLVQEDFYDAQGKLYWHFYEPTALQIGKITIEEMLEDAEERGKEKGKTLR